jgi:hypothetical protein
MPRKSLRRLLLGSALLLFSVNTKAAPIFVFNVLAGTSQQAVDGFTAAANMWSSLLSDNVTIYMTIGFNSLGGGILAQAGSTQGTISYGGFRAALAADATSADDATAILNLPGGASVDLLLNRTANSPFGAGSATPYVDNDGDANNTTIRMSTANAKAIGVFGAATQPGTCPGGAVGCDAFLQFNSDFAFDFDRSNGITAGQFDFVGVAAHEIGHALGFFSGVDILDINSPPINGPFDDNLFTFLSPLDLFRWSALSLASGVRDWTADTRAKYFSINGGATDLGGFATGVNFGDGRQASHWKDGLGLGIMDPTAAPGEFLSITMLDLRGFDVIGWNLEPIPEPATILLSGMGLLAVIAFRKRA